MLPGRCHVFARVDPRMEPSPVTTEAPDHDLGGLWVGHGVRSHGRTSLVSGPNADPSMAPRPSPRYPAAAQRYLRASGARNPSRPQRSPDETASHIPHLIRAASVGPAMQPTPHPVEAERLLPPLAVVVGLALGGNAVGWPRLLALREDPEALRQRVEPRGAALPVMRPIAEPEDQLPAPVATRRFISGGERTPTAGSERRAAPVRAPRRWSHNPARRRASRPTRPGSHWTPTAALGSRGRGPPRVSPPPR